MKEATNEQLILVANELNALLFDPGKPEIPLDDPETALVKIFESIDILEPTDTMTDDLIEIIDQTSLGQYVDSSKNTDGDITIRDLFIARTKIPLEPLEEEQPPEEEKAPEEEPEEEAPVQDEIPEEQKDEPEQEEEPEPEKEKPAEPPQGINYEAIAEELKKRDLVRKRAKSRWEKGQSPYSISMRLTCTNPDMSLIELQELFTKETGLEIESDMRQGIRTAYSIVRSIVKNLRDNGLMTKKAAKRTTKAKE